MTTRLPASRSQPRSRARSWSNPRSQRWILAGLMLLVGGCRYVDTVLDPPEPTVDPRYAFPTFAAIGEPMVPLDAVPEVWDFPPCDGWRDGSAERLRLGNALTAQMPPDPGWVPSEAGSATILVRYPGHSSVPSAFLYMETIGDDDPGVALRQFLGRVDRRLAPSAPSAVSKEPESAKAGVPSEGGKVETEDEQQADDGETPVSMPDPTPEPVDPEPVPPAALGVVPPDDVGTGTEADRDDEPTGLGETTADEIFGVGFESEKRGFSGWRWIGACGAVEPAEVLSSESIPSSEANPSAEALATSTAIKPFLRLGRSRGAWRRQANAQPVPAFLILATVTFPDRPRYGAHIAVVCAQAPTCADAPALAQLLGSIRGSSVGGPESSGQLTEPLADLAQEVGVSLVEGRRQSLAAAEAPPPATVGE